MATLLLLFTLLGGSPAVGTQTPTSHVQPDKGGSNLKGA